MADSPYTLAHLMGAGPDGLAYAATEARTGARVLVHRLSLNADRLRELAERARRVALPTGPGFLQTLSSSLEGPGPFVLVTQAREQTLAQRLTQGPLSRSDALGLLRAVATTLAEAHRVGLHHGSVSPATLWLDAALQPALDFSGVATMPVSLTSELHAPESVLGPGSDIYALGGIAEVLFGWQPDSTATGGKADDARALVREMKEAEPSWRLAALDVADRLRMLAEGTSPQAASEPLREIAQLGRFKIQELLGKGAMGRVYRAIDLADGTSVALKVLDGGGSTSNLDLRRFRKEARLLADVRNPYIANLIEVNRDQGFHFIAV